MRSVAGTVVDERDEMLGRRDASSRRRASLTPTTRPGGAAPSTALPAGGAGSAVALSNPGGGPATANGVADPSPSPGADVVVRDLMPDQRALAFRR